MMTVSMSIASQLMIHPPRVMFEDEDDNLAPMKNHMTIRTIINTIQEIDHRASDLSIVVNSFLVESN